MSKKIPKGWKIIELGELAEIKGGKRLPKGANLVNYPTNHPYIRTKDIHDNKILVNELRFVPDELFPKIAKYTVEKGDIIISIVGTIGLCAIIPEELHLANLTENCAKVVNINHNILDRKFLFYYLISNRGQEEIKTKNVGSTQPKLPLYNIKSIRIPIPPLPEQRAIASVLSSLDDKIDLLHRQNKTLEEMAEALFRKWFIEDAKKEWEEKQLNVLINKIISGEWGKEKPEGKFTEKVYCLRGTDIADLKNSIPKKTPVRFIKKNKKEKIEPQTGDIIFEISGGTEKQSTGRAYFINNSIKQLFDAPIVFSNFCKLIRPVKKEYSFFLYSYLVFLYNQEEFFNFENGTSGIKNLDYKSLLYDTTFILPPESDIIKYDKIVKPLFEKIGRNKLQIRTLEKMRDTLLPKLMNGKLRVRI